MHAGHESLLIRCRSGLLRIDQKQSVTIQITTLKLSVPGLSDNYDPEPYSSATQLSSEFSVSAYYEYLIELFEFDPEPYSSATRVRNPTFIIRAL